MAVTNNRKISELVSAEQVGNDDLVVLVQNGETKNAKKSQITEENYTAVEKDKLSKIEDGANNYVLPDDVVKEDDITDVVRTETLKTELAKYSLITETGAQVALLLDNSTYELTCQLYDKDGNTIYTSDPVDLPLETMVVNATYNSDTKEIVLELQNGNTVSFSVADLVSGLVSETDLANQLKLYAKTADVNKSIADLDSKIDSTKTELDAKIGKEVVIGTEADTDADTKILIEEDSINSMGTEVTNSLEGSEKNMSPSVYVLKNILGLDNIAWDSTIVYTKNKVVFYKDSLYKNKTGTSTTTAPDLDPTNWEVTSLIVNS